jgi:hypothetical protein
MELSGTEGGWIFAPYIGAVLHHYIHLFTSYKFLTMTYMRNNACVIQVNPAAAAVAWFFNLLMFIQWNLLRISPPKKFSCLRRHWFSINFSHVINIYIVLFMCFPLRGISCLRSMKIWWHSFHPLNTFSHQILTISHLFSLLPTSSDQIMLAIHKDSSPS